MTIELKKFGKTLTSRDSGREAYKVLESSLQNIPESEDIILDFEGINTFSPSWGDEVVLTLVKNKPNKVILINTQNKSVTETFKLLSDINNINFNFQ